MDAFETYTVPRLTVGAVVTSRKGRTYTVLAHDDKGFTLGRVGSASTVRITRANVNKTAKRLRAGEVLAWQANPSKGGISYTVAVTVGVVWALGGLCAATNDGYALGDC